MSETRCERSRPCCLFSKISVKNTITCGFKYTELLFMCLEINWAKISLHPTGSTFCLLFFFFHFLLHDLRRFWFVCADASSEGGEWKVCCIKSGMFIITRLVGTRVGNAVCVLAFLKFHRWRSFFCFAWNLPKAIFACAQEPTRQNLWVQTTGLKSTCKVICATPKLGVPI